MRYFNMLLTALASALCATYLVFWLRSRFMIITPTYKGAENEST